MAADPLGVGDGSSRNYSDWLAGTGLYPSGLFWGGESANLELMALRRVIQKASEAANSSDAADVLKPIVSDLSKKEIENALDKAVGIGPDNVSPNVNPNTGPDFTFDPNIVNPNVDLDLNLNIAEWLANNPDFTTVSPEAIAEYLAQQAEAQARDAADLTGDDPDLTGVDPDLTGTTQVFDAEGNPLFEPGVIYGPNGEPIEIDLLSNEFPPFEVDVGTPPPPVIPPPTTTEEETAEEEAAAAEAAAAEAAEAAEAAAAEAAAEEAAKAAEDAAAAEAAKEEEAGWDYDMGDEITDPDGTVWRHVGRHPVTGHIQWRTENPSAALLKIFREQNGRPWDGQERIVFSVPEGVDPRTAAEREEELPTEEEEEVVPVPVNDVCPVGWVNVGGVCISKPDDANDNGDDSDDTDDAGDDGLGDDGSGDDGSGDDGDGDDGEGDDGDGDDGEGDDGDGDDGEGDDGEGDGEGDDGDGDDGDGDGDGEEEGGGGGGFSKPAGSFSPSSMMSGNAPMLQLPAFRPVMPQQKDYTVALNNIIQESLFEGMI